MKPRGSNKKLVRLASVGVLIVLAGVLVYLSMAGRAPRALTRPGVPRAVTPVRPPSQASRRRVFSFRRCAIRMS